jgi:hypothetical protein
MWSSEHSLLPLLALLPVAEVVVVAVGDAVVAQREVEQPLHRRVVRRHRRERRPLTRVVAVVVVAVTQFPRFEDRQPSRGFPSSHGQQPSTTTIRRMP